MVSKRVKRTELCQRFIIANSAFSWRGTWLAANTTKQVIAPGFELRQGKMWCGLMAYCGLSG